MRPAILAAAVLLAACAADAVPIRYGADTCAQCRMTISDTRFGAELVNDKGKAFTFDAIECLMSYLEVHPQLQPRAVWVTDFEHPPQLVRAERATYVRSPSLRSPMGANLAAFAPGRAGGDLVQRYGGEALSWTELRRQHRERAKEGGGAHEMMMHGQ